MTLNVVAVYRLEIKKVRPLLSHKITLPILGKFYLPFRELKKITESLSVVGIVFSGTNLAASPSHIFFG